MMKVSVNQRRSPCTSPRSARKTPSWQVIDDSTRIVVKVSAYGRFSTVVCSFHSAWPIAVAVAPLAMAVR